MQLRVLREGHSRFEGIARKLVGSGIPGCRGREASATKCNQMQSVLLVASRPHLLTEEGAHAVAEVGGACETFSFSQQTSFKMCPVNTEPIHNEVWRTQL